MTQKTASELLDRLKIDWRDMDNSEIGELIETVRKNQNQLAIRDSKSSKVTLRLPEEVKEISDELPTEQTNAGRQGIQVDQYGERMLQVADDISENNAEMVVQLPNLVKQMTLKKLHEKSEEINDNWEKVNTELCDIMFGL